MPILDVEIVGPPDDTQLDGLALRIADAAAEVFQSAPGETWVKLSVVPAERYAENGGGPPPDVRPVFVHVLKRRAPHGAELQAEVHALSAAVAAACARPIENIHLVYAPDGHERAAFGGRIVGD